MQQALTPYGPDDQQLVAGDHLAFGRCLRWFTADDRFDAQPLKGAGARLRMVGDVRIYNRSELIERLGWNEPPEETADSALFFAAWVRWGPEAVLQIEGDYACAVW